MLEILASVVLCTEVAFINQSVRKDHLIHSNKLQLITKKLQKPPHKSVHCSALLWLSKVFCNVKPQPPHCATIITTSTSNYSATTFNIIERLNDVTVTQKVLSFITHIHGVYPLISGRILSFKP